MIGFLYRRAISIKEAGERLGHTGAFPWASGALIRLGLAWRDWTLRYAVRQKPGKRAAWHECFAVEKMTLLKNSKRNGGYHGEIKAANREN